MSFWSLKATVIPKDSVPETNNMKINRKMKDNEVEGSWKWNVGLHVRENHIDNALCALRGNLPSKAVIISYEIKELLLQVRPHSINVSKTVSLLRSLSVPTEDLKWMNRIQKFEGHRRNPESEGDKLYKKKNWKLRKGQIYWVHL